MPHIETPIKPMAKIYFLACYPRECEYFCESPTSVIVMCLSLWPKKISFHKIIFVILLSMRYTISMRSQAEQPPDIATAI